MIGTRRGPVLTPAVIATGFGTTLVFVVGPVGFDLGAAEDGFDGLPLLLTTRAVFDVVAAPLEAFPPTVLVAAIPFSFSVPSPCGVLPDVAAGLLVDSALVLDCGLSLTPLTEGFFISAAGSAFMPGFDEALVRPFTSAFFSFRGISTISIISGGDSTPSSAASESCGCGVSGITGNGFLSSTSSRTTSKPGLRLSEDDISSGVFGESLSIKIRLSGLGFAGEYA